MSILSHFAQSPDYMYYETTTTNVDSGTAVAAVMAFIVFCLIFTVIAYVIAAFLLSRIFKKAGVEGWKAWVPIYNYWTVLELGGQKGFWAILLLIPFVNIASLVFIYIAMYHIGLKFGKESWFVLLALFLPLVWLIWLAFDESKWEGGEPVAVNAGQVPAYQPAVEPVAPVEETPPTQPTQTPPPTTPTPPTNPTI